MSPPFWPFKKKQPELEIVPESKIIQYGVSDESSAEKVLDDRSHLEDESYKSAMDKLGLIGSDTDKPITEDKASEEADAIAPVVTEDVATITSGEPEWVENEQDGYWYKKMDDGSWDPQAYVQTESGDFEPYS